MRAIVCEMCNSNDIVKQGDYYVCQNCLTKYEPDAARKLIVEIDDSAKTMNLYKLARRAREEGNAANAAQYYSQILEQRPDDWEAYFYCASNSATNVKIANMAMAAQNFSSAIVTSFKLLDDSDLSAEEKIEAAIEMGINVDHYGFMIAKNALSSFKEYLNIGGEIALQHADEYHSNLNSGLMCLANCSDCIETFFLNNTSYAETERYSYLKDLAVNGWKRVIELSCSADLPYRNDLVQKVLKYEPSYQAVVDQEEDQAAGSTGGCYIATAVYGSYDCPQVWTLRRYRDYELAETRYGRAFVKFYYAVSPALVRWLGDAEWFKDMWRGRLDALVKRCRSKGYSDEPYEDRIW